MWNRNCLLLPQHLCSPLFLVGFVLFSVQCFVDHCLSFCHFSFYHCVACLSSIYGFRLPLWYLQTFLMIKRMKCEKFIDGDNRPKVITIPHLTLCFLYCTLLSENADGTILMKRNKTTSLY